MQMQLSLNYKQNQIFKEISTKKIPFEFIRNKQNIEINLNHKHRQRLKMSDKQYYDQFQKDIQSGQIQNYFLKQQIRKQAYLRTTDYLYPRINFFDHQPINSKESQQLRKQLVFLYKPKVDLIRAQYDITELTKDYDKSYEEFIKMTLKNEIQQRQLTQSISQMHQMADILMNQPDLEKDSLYLYSKVEPTQMEQQEMDRIFEKYELAYKEGEQVEQNLASETIKRAKQFLRNHYD